MMRIVGWQGLLSQATKRGRIICFGTLVLVGAALTFMQVGFLGVGVPGSYVAYVLALLAPVAVGSLLLGPVLGTAYGVLCGAILLAHARLLPLDVYERFFTTPASSVLLLGGAALVIGVLFALLLRKEERPVRRLAFIALSCLAVAAVCTTVSGAITNNMLQGYSEVISMPYEDTTVDFYTMRYLALLNSTQSNLHVQVAAEFALMAICCVLIDVVVRNLQDTAQMRTLSTAVRLRLVAALVVAFLVVSSTGFVAITIGSERAAYVSMKDELNYLSTQIKEVERLGKIAEDAYLSGEDTGELEFFTSLSKLTDGYELNRDGTMLVFIDDVIMFTNNDNYYMGTTDQIALGKDVAEQLDDMCNTGQIICVPCADSYDDLDASVERTDDGIVTAQLAYLGAVKAGSFMVAYMVPFDLAYANRPQAMLWLSITAIVFLVALYGMATYVINDFACRPLAGTLESLRKITTGDFDELVHEASTVEFAVLSAGINSTVDALKEWIGEARRRMESELSAARAIQEGALPRDFPAFPNIDEVDLFALMNAARMVGGDFYDFFVVDDSTVGFLIADVAGKGIPASLFMMAAKNEIQNCMLSGMPLSEAMSVTNDHICAGDYENMFVTVWAATLNWRTGELTFVNAGHNYPLLRHNGSWDWVAVKGGLVIGAMDGVPYRSKTIVLEPGDELLLYTDGVNEAMCAAEEDYGNDRLLAFLQDHADLHPEQVVKALRADVAAWSDGVEQSDDVTILAVEYGA